MGSRKPIFRVKNAGADIDVVTSVTTLNFPPVETADVSAWNDSDPNGNGSQDLFELEIEGPGGDKTVSNALLYGKEGTIFYLHARLNDGMSFDIGATRGFRGRFRHSPQVTEYALVATLSAATNVDARVRPIRLVE